MCQISEKERDGIALREGDTPVRVDHIRIAWQRRGQADRCGLVLDGEREFLYPISARCELYTLA